MIGEGIKVSKVVSSPAFYHPCFAPCSLGLRSGRACLTASNIK